MPKEITPEEQERCNKLADASARAFYNGEFRTLSYRDEAKHVVERAREIWNEASDFGERNPDIFRSQFDVVGRIGCHFASLYESALRKDQTEQFRTLQEIAALTLIALAEMPDSVRRAVEHG